MFTENSKLGIGRKTRGIGDCASASSTYADLRALKFSGEREAQNLADEICDHFGWKRIAVYFTHRENKRLRAMAFYEDREIKLHALGETVGTLIHEVAHFPTIGDHHGSEFKAAHAKILDTLGPALLKRIKRTEKIIEVAEEVEEMPAEDIDECILALLEAFAERTNVVTVLGLSEGLAKMGVPAGHVKLAWDLAADFGLTVKCQ